MDSPKPLPNPQPTERPKEEEAPPPIPELSAEELDELLVKEDPAFVATVNTIETDLAKSTIVLDNLEVSEGSPVIKTPLQKWKAFINGVIHFRETFKTFFTWLKAGGYKVILQACISAPKVLLSQVGAGLTLFKKMSARRKVALIMMIFLGIAAFYLFKYLLSGGLNHLNLGPSYIGSFAEVADHAFEIEEHDEVEEFTTSLRHPDYFVLLKKVVVNLKVEDEHFPNPMATAQLFVEAASREAAIEIKDRESEVLDLVQRTLEDMTYTELETVKGKNKLKLVLRQKINVFLTKGRIRKLLFQNIIIKP